MREPEALRLANSLAAHSLSRHGQTQAAAELRRIYAENEFMLDLVKKLVAQRDALLEALKVVIDDLMYKDHARVIDVARAAIKQAEGEKT